MAQLNDPKVEIVEAKPDGLQLHISYDVTFRSWERGAWFTEQAEIFSDQGALLKSLKATAQAAWATQTGTVHRALPPVTIKRGKGAGQTGDFTLELAADDDVHALSVTLSITHLTPEDHTHPPVRASKRA